MILSDKLIYQAVTDGDIVIDPFDPKRLGTNSYDVTLSSLLLTHPGTLDAKIAPVSEERVIPEDGLVLVPGVLYLGATSEYTETRKYVPYLDGKSSVGRLGITIHCTAGRGDVGFCGVWTLEIHVVQPVRVYAGMPIGQLTYHTTGEVELAYDNKPGAKYRDGRDPRPQPSRMWKNFTSKRVCPCSECRRTGK